MGTDSLSETSSTAVLAGYLPPAPGAPHPPVSASPVPLVAVRLSRELLLIDDVACEAKTLARDRVQVMDASDARSEFEARMII